MEGSRIRRLRKLLKTKTEDGDKFLQDSKPDFIDFLAHTLHSFGQSPFIEKVAQMHPDMPSHMRHILSAKSLRQAKTRMRECHGVRGGGFFDGLKSIGNSVVNSAKSFGNQVASTAGKYYDMATPYIQKGLDYVKPIIKDNAGTVASMGASYIPVVGPLLGPAVKKGVDYLANRYL